MSSHIYFALRLVYRDGEYGPRINDYKTLAGAKSGLRMMRKDLLRKRWRYNSEARCFGSLSYKTRVEQAKVLGITKHTNTVEIMT